MAVPSATTWHPKGRFLRVLGVGFGIAVSLGSCFGSGIMRTPSEIAARLPSVALIMCAWIVGGLYSLIGAWSLSEVGAMIPSAGGYYAVARRAFGDYHRILLCFEIPALLCGGLRAASSGARGTTPLPCIWIPLYYGRCRPAFLRFSARCHRRRYTQQPVRVPPSDRQLPNLPRGAQEYRWNPASRSGRSRHH
jgi:hypothetical protein